MAWTSCQTREATVDAAPLQALLEAPHPPAPTCPGFRAPHLGGRLDLRVFLGADVEPQSAASALSSMIGYFGLHGVRFSFEGRVRRLPTHAMLARGDAQAALAPLAAFMAEHGRAQDPARDAINVVVLTRIAAPDSPATHYFSELSGLAVSDRLRRTGDPLAEALGLDGPVRGTLLLGIKDNPAARPGAIDLTAAHELGHLLGLSHTSGRGLMTPGAPRCAPPLSPAEVGQLRLALAQRQHTTR